MTSCFVFFFLFVFSLVYIQDIVVTSSHRLLHPVLEAQIYLICIVISSYLTVLNVFWDAPTYHSRGFSSIWSLDFAYKSTELDFQFPFELVNLHHLKHSSSHL